MKKQIILLATVLATGLTACEKDHNQKNEVEKPQSKEEMLTSDTWDVLSMRTVTTVNKSVVFDETNLINGRAEFKADRTVVASAPGEPTEVSSWNLIGDTLYIDSLAHHVDEISNKKLWLELEETENIPGYGEVKIVMSTRFAR